MTSCLLDQENQEEATFEEFREECLREFTMGELLSLEKGQRFAPKLVTQWLDVNDDPGPS